MQLTARQGIYLAALLHDIGKFWQRASDSRKVLKQQTLQMEGSICPTGKAGYATHIHTLFTSEFFEEFTGIFGSEVKENDNIHPLGLLSARHHKRELNDYEKIIQFADCLSSGHDRREEEDDLEKDSSYKYKKVMLLNPFDTVYRFTDKEKRSYYPLQELVTDQRILPERGLNTDESKQNEYEKLWKRFIEEVKKLPKGNFSFQMKSLLYLLKKYTWSIPSATNSMPDISLYDHLKTTAAIAVSLFDSIQEKEFGPLPTTLKGLHDEKKERFVLLAGDFSGIQNFIYQLSSKGAAKTLKGRSFYLGLIQDYVIQKVKDVFEIEDAHILMASGGRFQILLPNIKDKVKKVRAFVAEINLSLREEFGDTLYLALGEKAFAASSLLNPDEGNGQSKEKKLTYSDVVDEAYKNIDADKRRKFAFVMAPSFFAPGKTAGTSSEQVCHVTGQDLQKEEIEKLDNGLFVSKRVSEQMALGRWLKQSKYIVKVKKSFSRKKDQEIAPLRKYQNNNEEDALTYRFFKELSADDINKLSKTEPVVEVVTLNDTDFLHFSNTESRFASTFQFYGAAWAPDDVLKESEEGKKISPVEFTDIAHDGENNLMAVLRLDVDNLGDVFKNGFKYRDINKRYLNSISRYCSLSEKMDLFFSGYINHIIQNHFDSPSGFDGEMISGRFQKQQPNQHIMPVYAGGDDVFIISRWDIAPLIAKKIHDDFKIFTNHHIKVSLSGGISVVHDKYPIHKAANEASNAEEKAKKLPSVNGDPDGKDAFCLFGQAMSWDDFERTLKYMKQIIVWQKEMDKKTLLSFLRELYSEYHEQHHFGKWRWRSAYKLKRIGKSYDNEKDMCLLASWLFGGTYQGETFKRVEIIPKNKKSIIQRNPELVDLTGLSVRWIQSLTRNK